MHLRSGLAAIVLLLLLVGLPVGAQDTGGSFGGGFDDDSSSSSDSGSDYSSDSGSSGSYDSGSDSSGSSGSSDSGWSSSDDSGSSGSGRPMTPEERKIFFITMAIAIPALLGGIKLKDMWDGRRRAARPAPTPPKQPTLHFVTAQLAIDWRARAALQERLAQLARSGKAGSKQGRVELLKETVLALVRAELSWLYSRWHAVDVARPEAEGAFRAATVDARARFKREVVRDAGGVVEAQAVVAAPPSPADGPGVVVVTLFVACDRPLTSPVPRHATALRSALNSLLTLGAGNLIALEVVWSPAVESDRMSTAELEQLYPELALIDPESVAGRVFCAHCTGPYARELMTCPHCGAPASA
jgi:uncharacterized membrane protein